MSKIKIGSVFFGENQTLNFDPYIKKLDDNFKSEWNQQFVLGRMDPIATFQRTRRTIALSFDVPAKDLPDAIYKRKQLETLANFLYPAYKVVNPSNPQNEPPPINVLENANESQQEKIQKNTGKALRSSAYRKDVAIMSSAPLLSLHFSNLISDPNGQPLYGFIESYSINPYEDMGFFVKDNGTSPEYFPKAYLVAIQFNVVHTNPLGWDLKTYTRNGGVF